MNTHSSFDRETLQQFLANAFAVQESRISSQSLSDIMQVQRSVENGSLDLDGAMSHIVESARNVANAAGAAIALLNGDRLTYRAASGSSARSIGTQMTASLTVSPSARTNREILRVENAQIDNRIEADICRQFDVNSLLMLPIYRDGSVAGVLDIRFREAHAFQDGEVRTYRLMAEQIEAALFQATQPKPEKAAPEPQPVCETLEIAPRDEIVSYEEVSPSQDDFAHAPAFFMLPENEHSLYARCKAVASDISKMPGFRQSVLLATTFVQRAKNVRWQAGWATSAPAKLSSASRRSIVLVTALAQRVRNRRAGVEHAKIEHGKIIGWSVGWQARSSAVRRTFSSLARRTEVFANVLAQHARKFGWSTERRRLTLETIALVLAFTALIAYRGRGPTALPEPATLSSPIVIDRQAELPKPDPGSGVAVAQSEIVQSKETIRPGSPFKRVWVGQNEVDYVANDVTIRVFTAKPAARRIRPAAARVAQYGDDVTVRYFTPPPAGR